MLSERRFGEAAEACERAAAEHPDSMAVCAAWASALARTGRIADAAACYERLVGMCDGALNADPGDAMAAGHKARALHWLNRPGEAAKAAARTIESGLGDADMT